jgi:hypothetical protein
MVRCAIRCRLPPDLSERTGDKFREIVLKKHQRRQKR